MFISRHHVAFAHLSDSGWELISYLIITAMIFDLFKIQKVSIHNTECIREKIAELENSLAKIKTVFAV